MTSPTVLEYYENGKLAEWLDNCLYTDEAAKVRQLMYSSVPDLGPSLCSILGIPYTKPNGGVEASDRRKRLAQLRQYTSDENILAEVDHVAFSQEELVKLLEKEPNIEEIYLCGERFVIPKNRKKITYIGVNNPLIYVWTQLEEITVKQVKVSSDWEKFKPEQLWRSLAEQGNAIAQNELGVWCRVMDNDQEAFHWFCKAAEQGIADAQYRLAQCYRDGKGVVVDKEKAFKWFLKAAEQGLSDAQNQVGICYSRGHGIAPNLEKAVIWYRKAANQGHDWAQYWLARCYIDGDGVAVDKEKAFQWFHKAAEQGIADAQYRLAQCYRDGKGVAVDKEKACRWFRKAAKQGITQAKIMLESP